VPPTVTLDGVKLQVRPVDGRITFESATVPENPSRLFVVIIEVPELPARGVKSAEVVTIVKS
jgi:hypothetical protein